MSLLYQTVPANPVTPAPTPAAVLDPEENINRIVRPKSQEQRGETKSETHVDEREVRARMPESRGQKRVSDTDGRIDLDKADMEMARKAAEDGLEILCKSQVRLATVTPATYSYYPLCHFYHLQKPIQSRQSDGVMLMTEWTMTHWRI